MNLRGNLLGLALLLGLIAPALAQVGPNALSGNECWNAGQGPGGPTLGCLNVNVVRGGTPVATATITGATTISQTALRSGGNLIITAQPDAAVITLPPSPFPNGGIIGVCNGTTSNFATNVVSLAANSDQTLLHTITITTLTAGNCVHVQFNLANTTWYRIR